MGSCSQNIPCQTLFFSPHPGLGSLLLYHRLQVVRLALSLIHSSCPPYEYNGQTGLSLEALWHAVIADVAGVPPIPDTFMPASWYHMAFGYDQQRGKDPLLLVKPPSRIIPPQV